MTGLDIVFIGRTLSSAWGNGHASTYRSLLKGLHRRGHRVLFLERDQPWYAAHRDQWTPAYCEFELYGSFAELRAHYTQRVAQADAVIVGSHVDGALQVCDWVLSRARGVRAFYDIDTPVTLQRLAANACDYLGFQHIVAFDLMLSSTGGPTLQYLETQLGARRAEPLYCSVDVDAYAPRRCRKDLALGYMGTYSADRQSGLEELLLEPARQLAGHSFAVVGAQYPPQLKWPANVQRAHHCSPHEHVVFYGRQRFTLNLTRGEMRRRGFSPSVRLFEAAACETAIISDEWPGLAELFCPEEQIIIASSAREVIERLQFTSDAALLRMGQRAREQVLQEHSGVRRATELEGYLLSAACTVWGAPSRMAVNDSNAATLRGVS